MKENQREVGTAGREKPKNFQFWVAVKNKSYRCGGRIALRVEGRGILGWTLGKAKPKKTDGNLEKIKNKQVRLGGRSVYHMETKNH